MDLGDPATQAQQEAAMNKIRPRIWSEDATDVKRNKQRQSSMGCVSDKLIFRTLIPKGIRPIPRSTGQSCVTFAHFSQVTKTVLTLTFATFTSAWPLDV